MAKDLTQTLIVAERGSDAGRVRDVSRNSLESLVIEQDPAESIAAFALRVRAEATAMEREGQAATCVVVVGGGRADADTVSARSLMIRSLASTMLRASGGELVLESDGSPDRYTMAALAATTAEQLRGSNVGIRHRDVARRAAAARRFVDAA